MKQREDKCLICLWSGPSEEVIDGGNGHWFCPQCGSEDTDDITANPYEEESDEDDELDLLV